MGFYFAGMEKKFSILSLMLKSETVNFPLWLEKSLLHQRIQFDEFAANTSI